MPGKLAAARASREATERFSMLPRRAGSTQSGLPTELEDASASEPSSTFACVSATRFASRQANTDTGVAPVPKQPEGNASSQSVTFLVTSGQHAQQNGTPTATAAALAQAQGMAGGHASSGGIAVQPRLPSIAAGQQSPLAVQQSVGSGPRSAPSAALPASSVRSSLDLQVSAAGIPDAEARPQAAAVWRGGGSGNSLTSAKLQTQQAAPQQPPSSSNADAQAGRDASSGGAAASGASAMAAAAAAAAAATAAVSSGAHAGSAGVSAANASGGSHGGAASSELIWTAAAPTERTRSGTSNAIPLRQSRLRAVASPSGAATSVHGGPTVGIPRGVDAATGSVSPSAEGSVNQASRLTRGASDGMTAGLAAGDSMTLQDRPYSVGTWTAAAPGVGGGRVGSVSAADSSSVGGAATPGSTAGFHSQAYSRGRTSVPRRCGPSQHAGPGFASEFFGEGGGSRTEEALPSAESSFTVRQTPSDVEDDVLERARTRRAVRSVTVATMGSGGNAGTAGAPAGEGSADAAAAAAAAADALARGAQAALALAAGPAGEAGPRMVIRLNHQPGHNRRPPNRHSSMPAMKREGVPAGVVGAGALGPSGMVRRSPLMRPPLSGGLLPEESVPEDGELEGSAQVDDNLSNTSLPAGLLGTAGDGLAGAGGGNNNMDRTRGGGADQAPTFSRVPSDSPITSQLSVTSSIFVQGPGSTAQQRYQSIPSGTATAVASGAGGGGAGGGAGGSSATALALAPAQPPSRFGNSGAQLPLPSAILRDVRAGGSSGQRGSFEEEAIGGRHVPQMLIAPAGAAAGGGGGAPSAAMVGSNPQLALSGMGLAAGDRPSHVSGRMLSGAHAQPSSSLAALHKAVEKLMLQDSGLYAKVQASMKGISSLAKETNKLEFTRDASGATVINQYVVVKTLGRGAFGKVKLCLNTLDGQLYAVKMINRAHLLRQLQKPSRPLRRRAPPPRNTSDTGLMNLHMHRTQTDGNLSISHTNITNNFGDAAQAAVPARASMDDTSPLVAIMREIAVMKKVDHPNVVRLHEVIDPPGSSYLMMVMEYCEGGCVMETRAQTGLAPLGEDTAREYFRQACLGLDYLHYNHVIHGDLKPENMLVSGTGLLKIADFGSSRFMGGDPTDATKTSCTPAFQSPEEISHMPVDPFAADLWALACCLYTFVFGRLPFVGSCVVDIYRAILTRPHTYPEDVACSPALRDLLDRMLDKDPGKRLALRDVGQHPWVTGGGQLPPLQFLQSLVGSGGEGPPPVIHVTHAEQVNAIDRSSLVSLVRARLKEKTCQPGEYLFKEGEEAHCVYMIMAGVVELTQHLRRPAAGPNGGGAGGGANGAHHGHSGPTGQGGAGGGAGGGSGGGPGGGGPGGGCDGASADLHDASFSVDLDESLTLDHPEGGQLITEAMNIVDGKLHIDRQQAIEMRRRMQGNLLGENAEYVVEVKGPGSVIGEMGLDDTTTATHRVSARARGPVTVVKLTEENFFKALLQMYGGAGAAAGAGGGSAASTTLTTSSISEAAGKAAPAAPAAPAPAPGLSAQHLMVMQYLEDSGSFATFPAQSAGAAYGTPGTGRFSMDAGAGRALQHMHHHHSLHAHHHHHHHHSPHAHPSYLGQSQHQQQGSAGATAASAAAAGPGSAAPAASAAGANGAGSSPAAAAAAAAAALLSPGDGGGVVRGVSGGGGMRGARGSVGGGLGAHRGMGAAGAAGGPKNSGVNSMLGVLNTIHSVNASRAGPMTSEEGIADL